MPAKISNKRNGGLSKRAPGGKALLMIDMITDFEFVDGEKLFRHALPMAKRLSRFKQRAMSAGVPVIYVNDNYGNWKEDFGQQVKSIEKNSARGRQIVELLRPAKDDYYILKPQRSGFYETPLAVLLASMNITELIITGVTTDICVMFTAHDAYMRGFRLSVPSDCSTAVESGFHRSALNLIKRVVDADLTPSTDLELR